MVEYLCLSLSGQRLGLYSLKQKSIIDYIITDALLMEGNVHVDGTYIRSSDHFLDIPTLISPKSIGNT